MGGGGGTPGKRGEPRRADRTSSPNVSNANSANWHVIVANVFYSQKVAKIKKTLITRFFLLKIENVKKTFFLHMQPTNNVRALKWHHELMVLTAMTVMMI